MTKISTKIVFLFLVLFVAHCFATDKTEETKRSFSAGIAFKELGLSDSLQALKNASFWGTFFLSQQNAIRIVGQFNFKNDDGAPLFDTLNRHDYIVLLSGEFVRSIKLKDNVTFFGALGPAISITNQIGDDLEFYELYALGTGATGSLGIEYQIWQNVAFIGEYTTSLFHVKRKVDGVDYYAGAPFNKVERTTALYSFFRGGITFNF